MKIKLFTKNMNIKLVQNDNETDLLIKKTNYTSFPNIFIEGDFIVGYSELAELHSSGKINEY